MSTVDDIASAPYRYDLFAVLRMLERDSRDRPRIGENRTLRDEVVRLSQNPYFAFPASNLAGFEQSGQKARITVHFLGQFGPQGALPIAVTEEAYGWLLRKDDAFPRFADLVSSRFLQLFFRAWADARPIAQEDRPLTNRFSTYAGVHIGIGSPTLRNLDAVPDARKLAFAGLLGAQAKSASRLQGFLKGLFGVGVEVDQFVGSHLQLDKQDCTRLGQAQSSLGRDIIIGSAVFSVQDKIRVRIFARDLAQYLDFLPSGRLCEQLVDAIAFYVGDELDWDVELALPIRDVVGTTLEACATDVGDRPSQSATGRKAAKPGLGMLGWTSWVAPNWAASEAYRCDARFHPSGIRRGQQRSSTNVQAQG